MEEVITKINARRNVVAEAYESKMKWAKIVCNVSAKASENIDDFYKLPQNDYAEAVAAGLAVIVAECRGLDTALQIIQTERQGMV